MLDQDSWKNEMEIGAENRISSKWEMDSESCWMETWTQFKIQDLQSNWETKKKDGKTISTNCSNS